MKFVPHLFVDVEAVQVTIKNITESGEHVIYACNGAEANLTECRATEYNFICRDVGKLRCQGLLSH